MVRTCEVALPLPLRTTFTYRVPEALDEATVIGSRVVVPFRNRAMLGVVLECGERPDAEALKEVAEVVDSDTGAFASIGRAGALDFELLPGADWRNVSRDAATLGRGAV